MLLLAVPCVVLVEVAELFIWANDRRRAGQAVDVRRADATTRCRRSTTTTTRPDGWTHRG